MIKVLHILFWSVLFPVALYGQDSARLFVINEGDTAYNCDIEVYFVCNNGESIRFNNGCNLDYSKKIDFKNVNKMRVIYEDIPLLYFENISYTDTTTKIIEGESDMPVLIIPSFQIAYEKQSEMYFIISKYNDVYIEDKSFPKEIRKMNKRFHDDKVGKTEMSLKYHMTNIQYVNTEN